MLNITTSVCAGYYDLIETPSGHTPAPMVSKRFWLRFVPLRIGKVRDSDFYECPNCGRKSFFKIHHCYCGHDLDRVGDDFRTSRKCVEINNLFMLSLLGKAKYIKSDRLHNDGVITQRHRQNFLVHFLMGFICYFAYCMGGIILLRENIGNNLVAFIFCASTGYGILVAYLWGGLFNGCYNS